MISMTSTATQAQWGDVIRTAQREPIMVTSHGHESVVILGAEEYRQLQLQALQAKIGIGMRQADRGEFSDATPEDIIREGDKLSEHAKTSV